MPTRASCYANTCKLLRQHVQAATHKDMPSRYVYWF